MVWYYSTSGRQNGPVSQEELIRLVGTGSVGPQDLVWCEGMKDWKPAGEVPELRPAPPSPPPLADPAGGSHNPYQAPSSGWAGLPPNPLEFGDEIVPGSQPLDTGMIIGRAWELTKRHFGLILLVMITCWALNFLGGMIVGMVTVPFTTGHTVNGEAVLSAPGQILNVAGNIVMQIFSVFLSLGLTRIGLNLVSGKPADFTMLFGESRKLVNGVIAYLLYVIMVAIGIVLLIVPGVYLALRFSQYKFAIIDKDMDAIAALKYSARITEGNKMNLLGLGILCGLIIIAGILALFLGLIVAGPLVYLISFVAYRWLQYGQVAVRDQGLPGPR